MTWLFVVKDDKGFQKRYVGLTFKGWKLVYKTVGTGYLQKHSKELGIYKKVVVSDKELDRIAGWEVNGNI